MQARGKPTLGSDDFTAPNPSFGALLTYYLKDGYRTAKEERRKREAELQEQGEDIPFPGWDILQEEALERGAQLFLTIRDEDGNPVRRVAAPSSAGIHRVHWDLRRSPPNPIDLSIPGFVPPWAGSPQGPLAAPGRYTVEMAVVSAGGVTPLGDPQEFQVNAVPGSALPVSDFDSVTDFQTSTSELLRQAQGAAEEIRRAEERLRYMHHALVEAPQADVALFTSLDQLESSLAELRLRLMGDRVRGRMNEASTPSILSRIGRVAGSHWDTRQTPTGTQVQSLDVARSAFASLSNELGRFLSTDLPGLEAELEAAGAPWTPGRALPPK